METLLGVPMDVILVLSITTTVAICAALSLVALRRPWLQRLALRNAHRRRIQALLITLGLMLSTVVVTTAFNTGDMMAYTVRTLVASGLGRTDEIVLALPRDQRRNPGEYLSALLNGSLLTGLGSYFPEERATSLEAAVHGDTRIAGLTPAIGERVTVVNPDLQAVQGEVNLLALSVDYPAVFGLLRTTSGQPLSLETLGPDELIANVEAAAQLGAEPGSRLEVRSRDGTFPLAVQAIAESTSLGGAQPTLFLPLPSYQRLTSRDARINQILVANRGDISSSVSLSTEVARSLRVALADRQAAAQLFDLLHGEGARAEILSAGRTADGRQRENLEALARSLERTEMSDEFVSLATDTDVERRLFPLAARAGFAAGRGAGGPPTISSLRVLEVKQASQNQAERWGGALTSVFLILGLFSLATGALLVFLIFVTVAAERRSELGVFRALGAPRRDVVVMFLFEGALYDAVASALGVALGSLLAMAIIAQGNVALGEYGVQLQVHFESRSLLIAYCLGLILTFLSVGYSAVHISRLSVVRAIRNLPEPPRPRRRLTTAITPPGVALLGAFGLWIGLNQNLALPQACGTALVLLGLALLARQLLDALAIKAWLRDRLAFAPCTLGLLAYWLLPAGWPPLDLVRPAPRSIDLYFLAGPSMVLAAVWLLTYNLRILTGPAVWLTSGLHSLGLAVRTATANPLTHRLRTGMVMAMFALVIFNMVVASVLLTATHRAYSDPEALAGGFDVRVDPARFGDLPDLSETLQRAAVVRPDDFTAIGRLTSRPGQALELGPGSRRWRPYALQEVDTGFVDGLRSPLAARADAFSSDGELWSAFLAQAGLAVVGGPAVGSRETDPTQSSGFRFSSVFQDQTRFAPTDVWVRDDAGGPAVRLTVVGVLDPRLSFGPALYTRAGTVQSASSQAQRVSYFLKSRTGADPSALALGLNLSLNVPGVRAAAIGEDVRRIQSVRALLNELLQGFFGIGLLAGLAALGIMSLRAVVERRQQIGVLRALGFRRQMVRLSLLLETSLVAALGISVGIALGLALAHRLVDYLGGQYPEILFTVPWTQIGLIALGAYIAALISAALPLWQIGRIEPAEALSSE